MATNHSLRAALISGSRTHAQTNLHRLTNSSHAGNAVMAAAGAILLWIVAPRRTRWVAAVLLTAAGAWAGRRWLQQNLCCATGRCRDLDEKADPMLEPGASLTDLRSYQSFPASDPPGTI